ncbi:MAG TPA: TonB-dependent receptor plug domain-containing protein [Sphingomicrobium sp.]|nr:TonB-dependent receptor plug domain-containing protein [Sphingomicrobium sp.]
MLFATTAPLPAFAQQAATVGPAREEELPADEDGEEIVVQGQRLRGSVAGDIPPENVLGPRDIRSTGATSISELLDAVASQTGSARGRGGGRPIMLLNGQRISGFRELRDLPPEAIERMEVLPEEVALKYGYPADQRVVNIVLRRRFHSTSAELRARTSTDGGYSSGQGEATRLIIRDGQRTSLNLRVEGNSVLTEDERDIALQPVAPDADNVDPRPYRTLVGLRRNIRLSGTANRTILGDVAATLNGEVERDRGQSRFGVPTGILDDGGTEILRAFPGHPLNRDSTTEAVRFGGVLNWQEVKWRLSSTANAELTRTTTRSDRGNDLGEVQARLDAGDPTLDPLGNLGLLSDLPRDRSRSARRSLAVDGIATGPLLALPAGDANATFRLGASRLDLDSKSSRLDMVTRSDLGRTRLEGSASLDLPITRRSASIGRLTANANAGLTQLSDFGTLTTLGAGLNWSPKPRMSLIASWTREEGAPSLQQLGDPVIETPGLRFFDFTTGETAVVTSLTGGNPDLRSDSRRVLKIGGNWQPMEKTDLRLRAEYVRQSIDDPQASFPAASEALEAAFPGRFQRDPSGTLVRVDLRPVNFEQSRRDTFRWGFDFTKPLTSKPPSQAAIQAMRQRFMGGQAPPGGGPQTPRPESAAPAGPPQGGGFGGRGGFGGGGRFGGRQGGRLTLSLTHTLSLVDEVTIADGVPDLDYLDGEAVGAFGGRPRHELQMETGYYNNGLGARLQGSWRSGTTVDSSVGDLSFAPHADVDLRLFANLGERFDLVAKHPILRGTSVRFDIDNIFNARPRVRDAGGLTPLSYQPDLLEPVGRTVGITIRKLFVPRSFFRRGGQGQRPAN